MEILFTVVAILAMIMLGVLLIHSLNAQHDERIAGFHYSNALPGTGRRSRKRHHRPPTVSADSPDATTHSEPQDGTGDGTGTGPGDGR